jgi:hypothetical protein
VTLNGLYHRLADMRGGDSRQTLMLAQSPARHLLESFIEDGGVLLDQDDQLPARLEKIFSAGTS